ncbi:MAG: hypothetical protein IJ561_04010 [Ruminococcus sp.]|nr:hypothetical protein [Ruminococcus sp.]
MPNICTLTLIAADGTEETVTQPVKLVFRKDKYASGTELSGRIIRSGAAGEAVRVKLEAGGRLIHDGYLEYCRQEMLGGRSVLSFTSKGFSWLLAQNEPVPGINYQVNLASLGALNTQIPNVTYESGTRTVNYISVKEHSSIWDAVSAYAMKAYGTQPYIIGANTVSVTGTQGTMRSYASSDLISTGTLCDRRTMLSKAYMSDADGQYSEQVSNSAAVDAGIVREKYFQFDRQWLSSLNMGLRYRINRTVRRSDMSFVKLLGYQGEELFDSCTFTYGGQQTTLTVGSIEVVFEKGIAVSTLGQMNETEL